MADTLNLHVLLSRNYLGLPPLDLNDGVGYRCSTQLLGSMVSWQRDSITSPYMDGAVTFNRQRQMVTEPVVVDIYGRTAAGAGLTMALMHSNEDALVSAISQNDFTLTLSVDGEMWAYQCEASDHQMKRDGHFMRARRGQATIQLLRHPVPLTGVA